MNAPTRILTIAGLALVPAGLAAAQLTIDPAQNVIAGSQPTGAAMADFDGDGDLDIATAVDGPDRIQILLGDGLGGFAAGPASLLPASSSPQDVKAGDFDGDGLVDLAVALRDPVGSVAIMRNVGGATFALASSHAVGDRPLGLAVADHDGDGDLDVAVASRDSNSASVLTNTGAGFSVQTLAAGLEPRMAAFGDFDGDGDRDLAVTNHDDRTISIYLNAGGAFAASATVPSGGIGRPEGMVSADVDGNGFADLVVAINGAGAEAISLYLSDGTSFAAGIMSPVTGLNTGQVALADLDCDGVLDAIASSEDSNTVSVLEGLGAAGFGPAMSMAAGTTPGEIATGDVDGDGDVDFAVANRDSNNVSIFGNDSCDGTVEPDPCTADLDGSGTVDFNDLLDLLSQWGDCG